MKINNLLVPGLLVVGVLLIAVSILFPQKKMAALFRSDSLAKVIEKSGSVVRQNNQMPGPQEIEAQQTLQARDTLRTTEEADILIEFNNGGQLRLSESTEVLIDRLENGQAIAIIREGEVAIEKFGEAPGFWLRQDGQLYSATDFALLDKSKNSKLTDMLPASQTQEQISQVEIENTLNAKKNDFFRCYGQLIQRLPQSTGQVLLSFTIERQGRPNKVEISKTDINDTVFKSCLIEIVSRTRFRAFSGPPVTTVFPIRFE